MSPLHSGGEGRPQRGGGAEEGMQMMLHRGEDMLLASDRWAGAMCTFD